MDRIYDLFPPTGTEKVYFYILSHTDAKTKVFNKTYAQIKKDTGVSEPTISKVFNILKEHKLLVPLGQSRWQNNIIAGVSDSCEGEDVYIRIRT